MPGYLFDWTAKPNPTTNDPEWADRLTPGPHNWVTCDGVRYGPEVRRFMTGPDGWVELAIIGKDSGGEETVETEVFLTETGEAVPPDQVPEWNSKVPQPDGTWKDKYGERVKTVTVRGHVKFTPDQIPEHASVT